MKSSQFLGIVGLMTLSLIMAARSKEYGPTVSDAYQVTGKVIQITTDVTKILWTGTHLLKESDK